MKSFFITSTGTEIGKTVVTTSLCYQLMQAGHSVVASKPIISGWDDADEGNDTKQIIASLGLRADEATIERISPWRFKEPLSPDMAAARENKVIDSAALVEHCRHIMTGDADYGLIEGVGGLCVPLNAQATVLDVIKELNIPVILVVGSYLGTLSHTLASLKLLAYENVKVQAVVVSESAESPVSLEETIATLRQHSDAKIVALPRVSGVQNIWESASDIVEAAGFAD